MNLKGLFGERGIAVRAVKELGGGKLPSDFGMSKKELRAFPAHTHNGNCSSGGRLDFVTEAICALLSVCSGRISNQLPAGVISP